MEKIIGITQFSLPKTVVVLGNFDGIHKGHKTLINKAKEIAKTKNIQSALFTFETHPSFIIQHKEPVDLIYVSEEKLKALEDLDIDYYIEYPFDEEISKFEPEEFIKHIIMDKLNADTIIVGEDYRFGKKRKGDVELLKSLSGKYNFNIIAMPKLKYNGKEISSTWVREEIKAGNMELIYNLTGRRFFFLGRVEDGKKLGRKIGFPTANIVPKKSKVLPPNGVYISKVIINNEEFYGLTNVGNKPTVNGDKINVETYILDFHRNIYGENIIVELYKYIRPEFKFNKLEELIEQIEKDLLVLNKYFDFKD